MLYMWGKGRYLGYVDILGFSLKNMKIIHSDERYNFRNHNNFLRLI